MTLLILAGAWAVVSQSDFSDGDVTLLNNLRKTCIFGLIVGKDDEIMINHCIFSSNQPSLQVVHPGRYGKTSDHPMPTQHSTTGQR